MKSKFRILMPAVVALVACGSPSGENVSENQASITSAADKVAYDFFVSKGLRNFQAAGIVGNLDQESQMNPGAVQPNGVGHGIAQWSSGGRWNGSANDNVVWFASTRGESAGSLNLQLEFIWYELETFSEYGLSRLRQTTNVADATIGFDANFEQCGCDDSSRIRYAQATLDAFGNDAPPPPPPPPPPGPPTATPGPLSGCGAIPPGGGLAPGAAMWSCDGRFQLAMQADGNLVEYGPVGPMWSTGTNGQSGYAAFMQGDGNFVLYNHTSNPLFASNTGGHGGATFYVQTDGNLVIYSDNQPIWSSATNYPSTPTQPTGCGAIPAGHGIAAGSGVTSCDGRFNLAMQTDGNLVLYQGGSPIWSTGTSGKQGYKAEMQGDGNFVLYDARGAAIWASNTGGHPGAGFVLQTDGNGVVYSGGSGGTPLWSSGTSGH